MFGLSKKKKKEKAERAFVEMITTLAKSQAELYKNQGHLYKEINDLRKLVKELTRDVMQEIEYVIDLMENPPIPKAKSEELDYIG